MTDIEHVQHSPAQRGISMVELLDSAIEEADRRRADLAEQGDLDGLAHGLVQVRELQRKLSMLESQTDGDVSRLNRHAGNRSEVPGLGTLETNRRSTRTRWDSELLFGRLVATIGALATIDDNGEIVGDTATADRAVALLREHLAPCLPLTASCGWRTTGLKAAGIDPNQYREQEPGPDHTRIIGADGIH